MATRIKKLFLQGPSYLNYVSHPDLAFAKVITVKRNGARQYQVEAIPSGMEANVYHDQVNGKLIWSNEKYFNGPMRDDNNNQIIEHVHVLYTAGGMDIIDVPPVDVPDIPPEPTPDPPPEDESGDPVVFTEPFKLSTSILLICDEAEVPLYHTGYVNPGTIMYTDPGMTTLVTGKKFMLDVYTNVIYNMDLTTGEVISVAGAC